jgi:hypothetical protein
MAAGARHTSSSPTTSTGRPAGAWTRLANTPPAELPEPMARAPSGPDAPAASSALSRSFARPLASVFSRVSATDCSDSIPAHSFHRFCSARICEFKASRVPNVFRYRAKASAATSYASLSPELKKRCTTSRREPSKSGKAEASNSMESNDLRRNMTSFSCFANVSAFNFNRNPFSDDCASIASASASHAAKCRRTVWTCAPDISANRSTLRTRTPSGPPNRKSRRASRTSGVFPCFVISPTADMPRTMPPAGADDKHHATTSTTPPRPPADPATTPPRAPRPGRISAKIENPNPPGFIRWQTMRDRARRLHQSEPLENEPLAPISPVEPFLMPPVYASFPPISKR